MADNILNNVRIAHKNDTKSNWATKNPVLLKGEIGIEFDPSVADNSYIVKFKIGDGTSNWADLDYFGGEVTLPAPDGTSIVADGNTWSIAGFGAATANKFPVKRITGSTASIEWVALPSHIADLDTMYSKLSGIEAGAQVNTVDSVNGKTGEVTLSASDVGLGNVGNFKAVSTVANQGLTDTEKSAARDNIGAGTSSFSGSYNDLTNKPTLGTAAAKNVAASGNAAATEVVMGNDTRLTDARKASDVSAWAKASTKPTYTASEVGAIPTTQKGAASGVATLDANGQVPTSQLPSFVDDVLEGSAQSVTQSAAGTYTATGFILKGETKACTPEDGKIYIDSVGDNATNIEFRWTGTQFASIGTNLVLGETSNTAYRGDRGKTAYDHSQSAHAPANAEANVINAITVGGTAATITNKSAAIPIATSSKAGVVKSSSSNNTVAVNSSSGVMTVNKITTDKLVAGTNTLILDCGNATI